MARSPNGSVKRHRVPNAHTREITGSRPKKLRIYWPVERWCQDNLGTFKFSWSRSHGCMYLNASATDLMLFAIRFP